MREALFTFSILTVERVGRRIIFRYERAERRSLVILILEVDNFLGNLATVQRVSYSRHPGLIVFVGAEIDLNKFGDGGHGVLC